MLAKEVRHHAVRRVLQPHHPVQQFGGHSSSAFGCIERLSLGDALLLPAMKTLFATLRARPHLVTSVALGTLAGFAAPASLHVVTRGLVGWNVGVWLYLALIAGMTWRADHARMRQLATMHAEGAATVLAIVVLAAAVSLGAIFIELSVAKAGTRYALPHVLFALTTVTGSWLLLPTLFMLDYASAYYHRTDGSGLTFPGASSADRLGYIDFAYFSFTIAVALQTSDVLITSPSIRRLVLLQSVLSFAFNTLILALTVNIAAQLF